MWNGCVHLVSIDSSRANSFLPLTNTTAFLPSATRYLNRKLWRGISPSGLQARPFHLDSLRFVQLFACSSVHTFLSNTYKISFGF
jgi:hypothetical protein